MKSKLGYKYVNRHIKGSTLPEMLILLILTGIILLSVFDGFSLFERFRQDMIRNMDKELADISGHYRLEEAFSRSDSIMSTDAELTLFSKGVKWAGIEIKDSSLVIRQGGDISDTLLRGISSFEIVKNNYSPELIDSLFVLRATVLLKYGISYNPCLTAMWKIKEEEAQTNID